ncbi:MAG TPA: hypothetical protein VD794_11640 [Flavisolibacter sp.]|nr:hypothetical protein [Flavisolibacter sp.]
MKQGEYIERKFSVLARLTLGMAVFLIVRDSLLITGIIPERSPLTFWLTVITGAVSLVGILIGLDACWWHFKSHKRRFFKVINGELMLRLSVIIYIAIALLFL